MSPSTVKPIAPHSRIESLDLLRGFALLGILIMNIVSFSNIGTGYINPTVGAGLDGLNASVHAFGHLFADMRFMSLFSILFGAGIILFTNNVASKGGRPLALHYRRMFWLLMFGFIHAYFIWMGDILVMYAVCGSVAILFRKKAITTLGIWASIFFIIPILFSLMTHFFTPVSQQQEIFAFFTPTVDETLRELAAYRGSYMDQMPERIKGALNLQTTFFLVEQFWRIMAMMLAGMILFKLKIITGKWSGGWYKKAAVIGVASGLVISAMGLYRSYQMDWDGPWIMNVGHHYNYIASFLMALGYMAVVVLWSRSSWLPNLQVRLMAVGRMAFTNYILMSLICTFIFYGHGLGLFGKTDRLENLGIVVLVWIFLLWFSPFILARFERGPLEFLWRKLTYWGSK